MIAMARMYGVQTIGCTITPYGGRSEYGESVREAVNHWIRTSGAFYTVVDFDAATRSSRRSQALPFRNHFPDGTTPANPGYKMMADSVDLTIFSQPTPLSQSESKLNKIVRLSLLVAMVTLLDLSPGRSSRHSNLARFGGRLHDRQAQPVKCLYAAALVILGFPGLRCLHRLSCLHLESQRQPIVRCRHHPALGVQNPTLMWATSRRSAAMSCDPQTDR